MKEAVLLALLLSTLVSQASADLASDARVRHFLNRATFGATPELDARVRQTGIAAYLAQQLNFDAINDADTENRLADLAALRLNSKTLVRAHYDGIKQFVTNQSMMSAMPEEARVRYGLERLIGEGGTMQTPLSRDEQIKRVAARLDYRAIGELQHAKIIRAVHSERQLYEVMVDFWSNHFNIDIRKGAAGALKVVDDREVIRAHALGNFQDLLIASAHSPAMLIYLDNNENSVRRKIGWLEKGARNVLIRYFVGVDADSVGANGDAEGMIGGLNENYGRELLELHTLGVDGGYTQADVIDVSRAFTGWASNPFNGTFTFNKNNHDQTIKTVLGRQIDAGGMKDGDEVLNIIALHPATANHLAFKLCQRFVNDRPPANLVEEVAATFLRSGGDISATLEAIFTSEEFYDPDNVGVKLKSPFEFVVSSLRLLDADLRVEEREFLRNFTMAFEGLASTGTAGQALSNAKQKSVNWRLVEMGQPSFGYPAPTGYPEDSSYWQEPGLAMHRMNFALALTNGEVTGVKLADQDSNQLLSFVNLDIAALNETVDARLLVASVIASPNFQYR